MEIGTIQKKIEEEYLDAVMRDYMNPRNIEWRNINRKLADEDELESYIWSELSELEYHKGQYWDALDYIANIYHEEILEIMKKQLRMNDEEFETYIEESIVQRKDYDSAYDITYRYLADEYAFDNMYWFDDAVRAFVEKVEFDFDFKS